MSKESAEEDISNKKENSLVTKINESESTEESSLLNSIVEAVMRGDMNQVVTLALSHRSSDQKVKSMVDQALSSAISNKAKLTELKNDVTISTDSEIYCHNIVKTLEDVTVIEPSVSISPISNKPACVDSSNTSQNVLYSQRTQTKSNGNNEVPCTYYYPSDSVISSNCTNIDSTSNTVQYCQSGYSSHNTDLENHTDDSLNNNLSQYQITNSSLQNIETINTLSMSQQSVQVQLPGIGNFLLQIPQNFKPGEPITLPLNLPLTPVSQTSGVNPISIHMNTGQLLSNQLLSLYNPSSNINIAAGKKMRAIAPKPSKPTYRQPLIAPKTNSPNISTTAQDNLNINSTPLPAPSGPGRRKGNKGKKSGRKRGAPLKSHKNSSYASSTHSLDSQDASQFNETSSSLKQNCNNSISTRSTYQCNYYVNNESSDYLNQPHVTISQSFNEINSNTLLDNSDSGEKDLLSLAWEISNAELGNSDDFATAYNLYDTNNLGADSFVSSEILDQFLQNIQKDEIVELARCSATQINIDSRVSYASSFPTLPPCSTVLPSVTTSTYLNNYSSNTSNIELPQCIEIAEVVNLNTEDMLSELEKEENALLDKFVAQYGTAHQNELIRCDPQSVIPISLSSSSDCTLHIKTNETNNKDLDPHCQNDLSNDDSEKEIDLNIKESNELSEIAKQIEISCGSSHQDSDRIIKSKIYTICDNTENQNKLDCFAKIVDNNISESNYSNNVNNTLSFCAIPNTSLELIYSNNSDTLMDDKTQCLMSFNLDSKRHSESSFYITDSSLKSKTLDDFGLFEFCTDGELSLNMKSLNQESSDVIVDDDNKYIEPPILEDISDATPIQSDNESEDEDVDYEAFKFSRLQILAPEIKKPEPSELTKSLCFNNLVVDLPKLDCFQKINSVEKISKDWYMGVNKIVILDVFSTRKTEDFESDEVVNDFKVTKNDEEIVDEPSVLNDDNANCDINNEIKLSENSEEDILTSDETYIIETDKWKEREANILYSKTDIDSSDVHDISDQKPVENKMADQLSPIVESDCSIVENIKSSVTDDRIPSLEDNLNVQELSNEALNSDKKTRKSGIRSDNILFSKNYSECQNEELEKHSDLKLKATMSNVQNRQRRLRKPPKKLAIYQSINFIEKEFSVENIKKIKDKKKFLISEDQKLNSDFKRCTRSKGSISKSFDSFYEAISRHHKATSHSKRKLSLKKDSENLSGDFIEKIDENDNKSMDVVECDDSSNLIVSQNQNIVSDNLLNETAIDLSSKFEISESSKCLNRMKSNYKNPNIIRKYNLRKNSVTLKPEDQIKRNISQNHKNKNKVNNVINTNEDNVSIHETDNNSSEMSIHEISNIDESEKTATVHEYLYDYNMIDFHFAYNSCQGMVLDIGNQLNEPSSTIKTVLLANVVENKPYMSNNSEPIIKKCYPVRKINRKLRLCSGLEIMVTDKNVKYASILDTISSEIPSRFQCCTQFAKVSVISVSVKYEQPCNSSISEPICSEIITQNVSNNDDLPISDTDDVESLDAPLVIVEIEDVSEQILNSKCDDANENLMENKIENVINNNLIESETTENLIISKCDESNNFANKNMIEEPKKNDLFKGTYSLRPKDYQNNSSKRGIANKDVISQTNRRPIFNRACKKSERNSEKYDEKFSDNDLLSNINLKTPICAIEKLSHSDLIANFCTSPIIITNDSLSKPKTPEIHSELSIKHNKNKDNNMYRKIKVKIIKRGKTKSNIYKILKKTIWRRNVKRMFNYKSKLKKKPLIKCLQTNPEETSNLDKNVRLIEEGIAHIIIESKDYNKDLDIDDDDESINVENDSPNNQINTYLDSNNVETFSRNYGSFSLKIKVQKKDPTLSEEAVDMTKKHKKNSKRRKKLRHFLSSIIGSDDTTLNKLHSAEDSSSGRTKVNNCSSDVRRKNRKRKYTINQDAYVDSSDTNHDIRDYLLNERLPQLAVESVDQEEFQHRKPIKIKLFKSTNEDVNKTENGSFHSENVVFSLQKSESNDRKEYNRSTNQKILQIMNDLPSKPCRQAANLAKKKIFSTAKEDRRSQNATLTSIWNSKKFNNGTNKVSADILTIYQNERGKRPRGRPPKLNQSLFISEKQASSTGTLKLKIKLSKDFKNCDSQSSNGENSGRTSTNDSSILNSAVAGINGPSDALSLESNNFINGITEQLDQNIEYLEAKEAKVYFDPNQVDIERIKNSYYSSKKSNPDSFNIELHQRLYEHSVADISNKKPDNFTNNQNFSQYADIETVEVNNLYNTLSKDNSSNNKLSHLPKENINIADNCYNIIANREPQNLSQSNQNFQFENQLSPEKNPSETWQNSKNSSDSITPCRNSTGSWFSDHRNIRDPSFPNSNSILYNSYMTSSVKESKNCIGQNQNTSFVCENENSDPKLIQRSPSKRSGSSEGRKSGSNSFSLNETHNQLSPHYTRGGIGSVSSQLNIHPWSDDPNHNASLNHTAAAWMTYAQQQAAAAAYMDPQMKAYYNLALSQSMLNNPYCGSYGNPAANSENFYSSLHSQYLNNSKDTNEKLSISNTGIRNHNDPMGSFMEAAQMTSWEHFYSAAAMAGYHNSSQGAIDDYAGRAGNMLQAHHMLANGYPGSMLGRDHFTLDNNKPPLAHQNQSGTTSPVKLTASGSTPVSSTQAYSHVQMPYSHFSGTTVGFF